MADNRQHINEIQIQTQITDGKTQMSDTAQAGRIVVEPAQNGRIALNMITTTNTITLAIMSPAQTWDVCAALQSHLTESSDDTADKNTGIENDESVTPDNDTPSA